MFAARHFFKPRHRLVVEVNDVRRICPFHHIKCRLIQHEPVSHKLAIDRHRHLQVVLTGVRQADQFVTKCDNVFHESKVKNVKKLIE